MENRLILPYRKYVVPLHQFSWKSTFKALEQDIQILWQKCTAILRDNLTPSVFNTWFAPLEVVSYQNDVLVIRVKSQWIVEYIEENYLDLLSKVILRVFGENTRLEYRVLVDSTSGMVTPYKGENINLVNKNPIHNTLTKTPDDWDSQLNENYTFSTFIQGDTNKMARSAGMSISKEPGKTLFNPLFIYGKSGVGKTHLANAIGNQIARTYPHMKVLYVSANTFKLQYMEAVRSNNLPDFLLFYQGVDVLILDDIQYFAGIQGTQDTFFHIFNYLHQSRKQLIMTADRSPMELKDVQDRLLTRFKWGLSVEVLCPDIDLRRAILVDKTKRDGIELSEEIIDYIALNACNNVRDIEGVLASLMAYSTLMEKEVDLDLVKMVLARLVEIQPKQIQMEDIIGSVCEHEGITAKVVCGKSRQKEVNRARQLAIYLAKELTEMSYHEIGLALGHRSHATVLHAYNTVKDQQSFDQVLAHDIRALRYELQK